MAVGMNDPYECPDAYADVAICPRLTKGGLKKSHLKDPRSGSLLQKLIELPDEDLKTFRSIIRLELAVRKRERNGITKNPEKD
jgi:hypothetical protein